MSIFSKIKDEYFWQAIYISFLTFSGATLTCALIIDYILGYVPCPLCIYQRIPYIAIMVISILGLVLKTKISRKIILGLIALTLVSSAGISSYHVGVEHGWWEPMGQCIPNIDLAKNLSQEEFLNQLNAAPIADCRKPALTILGFSLAEINFVLSLMLLLLTLKLVKKNAKAAI